jgi:hypothetical protein
MLGKWLVSISFVRKMGMDETTTTSSLIIKEAGKGDHRTYTCRPATGDFKTANNRVFIGHGAVAEAKVSGVWHMAHSGEFFKILLVLFSITLFYDEI